MSQYHYRFLIIYWVTYLEEYEQSCNDYFAQMLNRGNNGQRLNAQDFCNPEYYEVYRDYYEIDATSTIFNEKLGKHPETFQIFKILGFTTVPSEEEVNIQSYRIKKSRDHLKKVRRISELLLKIANMDL